MHQKVQKTLIVTSPKLKIILKNKRSHKTSFKDMFLFILFPAKSRLYPRFSLNESDNEDSPTHRSNSYAQPYLNNIGQSQFLSQLQQQTLNNHKNRIYKTSTKQSVGLSSTPSTENCSESTLTESELAFGRDSTLLVNNGK
jgi:hypothetical protein